ncbi:MAG: hypothetical protein LBK27_02140 [Treponema sp.]|jgi:hypothetical protein|nr:hypothetical protein [Treponema sp.]
MRRFWHRALFCVLVLTLPPGGLRAGEFTDGLIRLVLHEDTGRFSLYYLEDLSRENFEPLFTDQDPRTSFFSILLNDKSYRLGESSAFRLRREAEETNPAFLFISPFLRIREEFSFIKTAGSSQANGIRITVSVENTGVQEINLGFRFLLDASLGERGRGAPPFLTDKRSIESETLITAQDDDRQWISRNDRLSLMGSISGGVERRPDQLHFANWKRLNEVPWKTSFTAGRNFNYLPYSIDDSAVCYYYEPRPLSRGESASYTILLAAEDPRGFDGPEKPPVRPARETVPLPANASSPAADGRAADLALLQDLLNRLDRYMAGEISITADDLAAMEASIARLKARYGLP